MIDIKEPRTAEEWVSQYLSEAGDLSNDDHFPLFTDIIRRAQEQAKNEAFVECATVCEVRKLITTEIRAYDKGFREGVATTTEKMQIATDVLVKQARREAIRKFSADCKEDGEWLYEFKRAVRREVIEECANIAKRYAEEDCDDADEFTMAANDIEEEIRGLLEKK